MTELPNNYALFAAIVYCVCTAIVVIFQWALAAGAPWAHLTMGGRYGTIEKGKHVRGNSLPTGVRIACAVQSLVLATLAYGLYRYATSAPQADSLGRLVWIIVGVAALAALLNAATPSRAERNLWLPITLIMLASSVTVALLA